MLNLTSRRRGVLIAVTETAACCWILHTNCGAVSWNLWRRCTPDMTWQFVQSSPLQLFLQVISFNKTVGIGNANNSYSNSYGGGGGFALWAPLADPERSPGTKTLILPGSTMLALSVTFMIRFFCGIILGYFSIIKWFYEWLVKSCSTERDISTLEKKIVERLPLLSLSRLSCLWLEHQSSLKRLCK